MSVVPEGRQSSTGGDRAGLVEERDFLLTSLDDLEAERAAGDMEAHDYDALRESYTARAAAVLRQLDDLDGADRQPRPEHGDTLGQVEEAVRSRTAETAVAGGGSRSVIGVSGTRRGGRGATVAVLAGAVLFATVAGAGVMHAAGQRLPGDNVSGSTPTTPVAKLLAQAQAEFGSQHLLQAVQTYDKVIAIDPRNAEALAYKGWLLRLAGHQGGDGALIDRGLDSIRAAEAAAPAYPDAHFFAGETLLRDKADPKGAVNEFEQFLADNPPPDYAPLVRGELQAARTMLGAPAATPSAVPGTPSTTAAPPPP